MLLQSVLTGESGSVEKHLEPTAGPKAVYQDKTCILFSVRQPTQQPVKQPVENAVAASSLLPHAACCTLELPSPTVT